MPGGRNLRDGDRRNVTVLFADMKDFTSLSERMDPEEMDSLMTQVFTLFEAVVRRHGGIVEKYIGDALVAVFGVPSLHEDDPARAVNCALDVLEEIHRINSSMSRRHVSVGFRIGISTGLITTGKRGEHDVVTGHAMSVASRLESEAKVNSILVSQETRDRCETDFIFSEPVTLAVKGKTEAITAYQVLERNVRPVGDDSAFVGRKDAVDAVLGRYLRHDYGETDGFVITGEGGIGKTRLAAQVIAGVRQLPGFDSPILYARAMPYRPRPFSVVVDLLTGYFGLTPSADREEIERTVSERSSVEERTAAGFAGLITGDTESHDNEAFVLLYLILKDIVKRHASGAFAPIIQIDNLQFMDRHSRDFFRFFLKNADVKPFFLLTDRAPDAGVQEVIAGLETIPLHPLGREDARELIALTCPADLPEETMNSVLDNSQGNPLFIREYVRFISENRDANALPTSMQNIFLTSIDPYEPQMRDLLKKLSVFAHSFSREDAAQIHEMTDGDRRMVEPALAFFVRESILVREGDLYMFRYDVFKTALYDSLLNYNKRILHRVIADLMVQKGRPHPVRLLLHLIRAEDYEQATRSLWEIPGLSSNLDYLPSINVLLDRIDRKEVDTYLSLLFVKSAILFNNGITDEADSLLKDIVELAISESSPMFAGSAYHLLTAHNLKAYCFEKARYCGSNALAYYRQAAAPPHRIQNLMEIMASSEVLRNRPDDVDRIIAEVENGELYGTYPGSEMQLSGLKADRLLMQGEYARARQLIEPMVADMAPDNEHWLSAHLMLGIANFHLCDWRELLRVDHEVLEGPSRHLANISQINAQIAVSHHFLGDEKAAAQRLQQSEFTCSQVKNEFDLIDAYRTLAEAYLILGDHGKAAEIARTGLGIGLRHSGTYPVLTLLMILVEIAGVDSDEPEVHFLMTEAGLLINRGVLLRNRDLALYHYFRSRLEADEGRAAEEAGLARAHIRLELERIGDDRLVGALMDVRSFGTVSRDLLGEVPGVHAAS